MRGNSDRTEVLLRRAAAGERAVLDELFSRHSDRLLRMVRMRLDPRLQGRVDPSDVLQEAYLEAVERLESYLKNPTLPFFLWLRFLTGQRILLLYRQHVRTRARDVRKERAIGRPAYPGANSTAISVQLLARMTSPSQAAIREEMQARVQEALNSMDPADREILALRHFERLSNAEAALELGIEEEAAKKRHTRALKRLKGVLDTLSPDLRDFR